MTPENDPQNKPDAPSAEEARSAIPALPAAPVVAEAGGPGTGTIVGYCRSCGKALDASTARPAQGTLFCQMHAPPPSAEASPWTAPGYHAGGPASPAPPPPPMPQSGSPALAFILGWIPGVGAIYNGQYSKGFVHVVIFGLLISIMSTNAAPGFEPLFGLLLAGFVFYMAFEALHTAKKRSAGQPVDEWSGLVATSRGGSKIPVGPIVLIAVGAAFLLNNLGLWDMRRIIRYWPALLILLGIHLLFNRIVDARASETRRERE